MLAKLFGAWGLIQWLEKPEVAAHHRRTCGQEEKYWLTKARASVIISPIIKESRIHCFSQSSMHTIFRQNSYSFHSFQRQKPKAVIWCDNQLVLQPIELHELHSGRWASTKMQYWLFQSAVMMNAAVSRLQTVPQQECKRDWRNWVLRELTCNFEEYGI